MATAPVISNLRLAPFHNGYAEEMVRWVRTDEELRHLAPSTEPPLTAEKICAWPKVGGHAYAYLTDVAADDSGAPQCQPIAYGELNSMRSSTSDFWLGHLIVNPDYRDRGIGCRFVRVLLAHAVEKFDAKTVSLVVFPSNRAARQCYAKAGFREVAEEFHRFGSNGKKHRLVRCEINRPMT